MAIPYLSNIDLRQNEIQNAVVHNQLNAPSNPIEGQIYFNTASNKLFVYNGSDWLDLTGDIRSIDPGDGLTGGGSNGDVTLSLDESGVTDGSYGSATAIPTFTVDVYGRLTEAGEVPIQTSFDITDGTTTETVNGGDTITFAGTANEIEVAVSATDTVTIGLPNDVTISNDLFVLGDLQVIGTTTTNNVETVSTSNGVIFEGSVADANELTLIAGVLTADRTVTLPDATGTVALTSDITAEKTANTIGDGTSTSFVVAHNFATRDVIVQLYDNTSGETVYADVERDANTNNVNISFSSAPALNSIRVLVYKI